MFVLLEGLLWHFTSGFYLLNFCVLSYFHKKLTVFRGGCVKEQTNNGCSLFSYFYDALSSTVLITAHHEILSGWMEPTNRKELNETKRYVFNLSTFIAVVSGKVFFSIQLK
jgi:hypothetical protein